MLAIRIGSSMNISLSQTKGIAFCFRIVIRYMDGCMHEKFSTNRFQRDICEMFSYLTLISGTHHTSNGIWTPRRKFSQWSVHIIDWTEHSENFFSCYVTFNNAIQWHHSFPGLALGTSFVSFVLSRDIFN